MVRLGWWLGGRFGYVFFYGFEHFLSNPLWLFAVWEGGMSFHGGLAGCYRRHVPVLAARQATPGVGCWICAR